MLLIKHEPSHKAESTLTKYVLWLISNKSVFLFF